MRTLSFRTFAVLLVILSLCAISSAQTGNSTLRGTVRDPQGNAVSGATVTLVDAERNFSRTQPTSDDGTYVFSSIPPSTYVLHVEASGFKKTSVLDVKALVDTTVDLDVAVEIGAVTETVNVTSGNDAPLNTTNATIGNTFESRRIQELPLNARNIVGLLSLQPGVTRLGEVNGGRRDQANITLDGVDVNEQQTGLDPVNGSTTVTPGDAFSSVLRITPDSVQEFRVTTSTPNADQGRSSGAQVSLVTKSGTNDFHGSLFWYHRNTVTTANDFFNNAAGSFVATDAAVLAGTARVGDPRVPRPKLLRNIFGGSLGGPVVKDRFFFFYSYEGRRDAAEQSVLRFVPTASLRQGNVIYRTNTGALATWTPANIAAAYPALTGVNPAALAILQTAPLPNDFSIGDGLNRAGFRFNAPIKNAFETHSARLDFIVTDRQTLFFRGNYQDDLYQQAPAFPGTPSPGLWYHPKGFVGGHTWTATSTLVNNLRVGLTRLALSQQGDSNANSVSFRDVYTPFLYQRTFNRTTPVWNVSNDVSWIKGTHTIQFGPNFRFIRNDRQSFASAFDSVLANPFFYSGGGASLLPTAPANLASSFTSDYQFAVTAVLGRGTQNAVNQIFNKDGSPVTPGTPSARSYATEEYDFYAQDTWKVRPDLTFTFGMRYGLNTPVYERGGFQLVPNVNLGEFFENRRDGMLRGVPFNQLISFNLGGKANNGPDYYEMDKNNFAPHVAIAWSPDFGDNFFGRAFGRSGRSVLRGGFRMLYDRVGSQLAVSSEAENSFGFSNATTNTSNRFNTTTAPPPLITSLNPNVRSAPFGLNPPTQLNFPLQRPPGFGIFASFDQSLKTPVQYTWNASYGRELPKGLSVEFSYVGRAARDLLLVRDVAQPNNITDPISGMDWFTAAARLNDLRLANTPIGSVPNIPFFENWYPGMGAAVFGDPSLSATQVWYIFHARPAVGGFNVVDYTLLQEFFDRDARVDRLFYHTQYAALQVLSSIGRSDYHGGSVSVRQRLGNDFLMDFNYTLSRSMDNGSTLETLRVLSNVIRNALDPQQEYSVSNFDVRHNMNMNFLAGLPFGRGKRFLSNSGSIVNGIVGGWQLTGIVRAHSGLPAGSPSDVGFWSTNYQLTSRGVRLNDVSSANVDVNGRPNLFADPRATYRSFRNSRAGESGDRNIDTLRIPSYFVFDAGLSKSFNMWYKEGHRLQIRWEVFNVTNTQRYGTIANLTLNPEPFLGSPPSNFGTYIGSQTPVGETRPGRVMQFALRYMF
jgi:hypothetical protein